MQIGETAGDCGALAADFLPVFPMISRQVAQGALFYGFSLEDHVPADHLLRSIDRFADLGAVRRRLAPLYSSTGRPSVDPELMIRMLLIGYCFGIRSERRLCDEVHLNLAYRWFCRLDLTDRVPDHSTFSKNRHGRFRTSDLLRHVFEATVRCCIAEGLVGGERFAVDASLIEADANRQRSTPRAEWDPTSTGAVIGSVSGTTGTGGGVFLAPVIWAPLPTQVSWVESQARA